MQTRSVLLALLSTIIGVVACSPSGGAITETGTGGDQGTLGGSPGSGGVASSGGITGTGGSKDTGGAPGTGGSPGTGGIVGHGGSGSGGTTASGGSSSDGGRAGSGSGGLAGNGSGGARPTGGVSGTGGQAGRTTATAPGSGGRTGTGGSTGAGGTAAGGSTSTGTSSGTVDCNAAMPSGGTQHSGNSQGGTGNLAWQIWTNSGTGKLTTFSTPAFSASWGGTGDYLGRLGYEWGNSGKAYTSYGKITADVVFKKSGSGGGFSYIGIYGWSNNPCVEYYILDDSMGSFPFNPYNSSQKGTATIDGETYKLFSNSTNGTGGSRCNQSSWSQFWSVRQKARQCGTITISDHFAAWDAAGMKLGSMIEAKILVETGGGSGTVDFPVANMKTSQ